MAFGGFQPAARENVGLLIGLAGPSGGGKTMSAMRLAAGIVGQGNRFAVIDTEARRSLHYADRFAFDHAELPPPFRPQAYTEAIRAADDAGYPVILIDSMSHEHAGEGGLLDWHEEELGRMAGGDAWKRDKLSVTAWIEPKKAHKRMVQRLLQSRATLIFCLRAEEKYKMIKDPKTGKTAPVSIGYQPICGKDFMYEMTCSFLLLPDAPGIPKPVKLQDQHRHLFPLDQPITEASGAALAEWARGGAPRPTVNQGSAQGTTEPGTASEPSSNGAGSAGRFNYRQWGKEHLDKLEACKSVSEMMDVAAPAAKIMSDMAKADEEAHQRLQARIQQLYQRFDEPAEPEPAEETGLPL